VSVDEPAPDSLLAQLAAAGDDQAFAQLVRRHKEPLYRLLRRYTGDADEAYEAVHEAWAALGRYDPERPFGAWLRTIAINKARDRGRRLVVRRLILGSRGLDEEALTVVDPSRAPDEVVIEDERAQRLDRAIGRLPDAMKAAMLLTAFDGYTQEEAGRILGVSAKTIETRVYRARKILAERLDDDMRLSAR
jgi:RNA polymerase sigma factor (sigma-70 family)